ncbi:MAG: class I SAM-dependent methyltransferase family protein [Candidatus Diapherotrites archaeon]|nr:class I SAM-dependent methyltransferase family protein [Candidatus Diapherotrites archaeon]
MGKTKGETARLFLLGEGLLDTSKELRKTDSDIIFPLLGPLSKAQEKALEKKAGRAKAIHALFTQKQKKPRSLEEALSKVLSKKELSELITSFDVIGQIALIMIPDELLPKEKLIGNALLESNPQIKTVARILGGHEGEFRIRPVEIIAGEKKAETLHAEWGCKYKVEVGKVFFSPRLSHERERISELIKKGETVAVLFAGVGPFAISFAKHSKAEKVFAVELNPDAFRLMQENIALNKVEGKVEAFEGDVRTVVPERLAGKCDRVVMPLPRGGENFLDVAFMALKPKGGVIHFYQFVEKSDIFGPPLEALKAAAKKAGRKIRIKNKKIVRSFSPSRVQVVVDAEAK